MRKRHHMMTMTVLADITTAGLLEPAVFFECDRDGIGAVVAFK